ncbi:C-terminal helicase domain-containing protein, partial [Variovorax robiniae]
HAWRSRSRRDRSIMQPLSCPEEFGCRQPGEFEVSIGENYRSHEDIVAYARGIGYPSQLSAHFKNTAVHPLSAVSLPSFGFPANLPYWPELKQMVSTSPAVMTLLHDDDLSSQGNEVEAMLVASLVWSLRETLSAELDGQKPGVTHAPPTSKQFWANSVGIVTPHRAQRALVVRELRKLWQGEAALIDEAVDTVEKFQGGERHVIIVSFGVADADVIAGEEAFLMQLQRTNVAISQAMAKCIVIMPTTLAGHVPQDKQALLTAHAIKDYVDDFCNHEQPISIQLPNGTTRGGKLRFRV